MVVPSSGAVAFSTIASEYSAFIASYNVGSSYYGFQYFTADGFRTFPSSNFAFSYFYGTSPDNEWACACDCACGK